MTIKHAIPGLATLALVVLAAPLVAHHSFSAFNMQTEMKINGTVKQVDWTNPHIWIWVDIENADGEIETWGMEGMSPNFLARRGWTHETLKAGDKIEAQIRPMKDGSQGGMFMGATMEDGTRLTMGGATPQQ